MTTNRTSRGLREFSFIKSPIYPKRAARRPGLSVRLRVLEGVACDCLLIPCSKMGRHPTRIRVGRTGLAETVSPACCRLPRVPLTWDFAHVSVAVVLGTEFAASVGMHARRWRCKRTSAITTLGASGVSRPSPAQRW